MSKQTLPTGQDNVIVRNQEVYGFLPKDVIDRLGDTSTQLDTEDQTALGAINELKSNLNILDNMLIDESVDFKVLNIVGTSYYPLQNLISKLGTLSRNTVFIGIHNYNGQRLYIAYLYAGMQYGGCIYATYDGSVKAQFIMAGTVSTKTFTLTNGG